MSSFSCVCNDIEYHINNKMKYKLINRSNNKNNKKQYSIT